MGAGSSSQPELSSYDHNPPVYGMDMNALFRDGIPRMLKVADDMHRMTNYIMDLRNMTLALVAISAVGVIGFLILRFAHNRSRRKRRLSRHHHEDGAHPATLPRYYYQSNYAPEPWDRPKSTFSHHSIEEKKMHDTRGSPDDRKPPNGNANTYKQYTPLCAPTEHDSSDESSRTMHESYPPSTRGGGVPNPMLISQAAANGPHSATPMPTPPALSQKRALEPIKLMVEDLPYADTHLSQ